MIKVLSQRFRKYLGPFNLLTVKVSFEAERFREELNQDFGFP